MTEDFWAHDSRGQFLQSLLRFALNIQTEKSINVFIVLLQQIFFKNWQAVALDVCELINVKLIDEHL